MLFRSLRRPSHSRRWCADELGPCRLADDKKSFANLGIVICLQSEVPIVGKSVRASGYATNILVGSIIIVPIFFPAISTQKARLKLQPSGLDVGVFIQCMQRFIVPIARLPHATQGHRAICTAIRVHMHHARTNAPHYTVRSAKFGSPHRRCQSIYG